jgi:hypothetical protein
MIQKGPRPLATHSHKPRSPAPTGPENLPTGCEKNEQASPAAAFSLSRSSLHQVASPAPTGPKKLPLGCENKEEPSPAAALSLSRSSLHQNGPPAPTGRDKLAQGEALGNEYQKAASPERARQSAAPFHRPLQNPASSKPEACQSISRWLSESASDTTGKEKKAAAPWRGARGPATPSGSEIYCDVTGGVGRWRGLNHRLMECHRSAMSSRPRDFRGIPLQGCSPHVAGYPRLFFGPSRSAPGWPLPRTGQNECDHA